MEILTVVSIIAILLGVLIPALSMVRNFAKETRQKAQFASIELALFAFRNDYGDYPESYLDSSISGYSYCGAHKLAEALVGWDLLGFHPKSLFRSDGLNPNLPPPDDVLYPDATTTPPAPPPPYPAWYVTNLESRKGLYLELETANAFRLGATAIGTTTCDGLYRDPAPLAPDRFVLCDSFNIKTITITQTDASGNTTTVRHRAGTPILYYRANTQYKDHDADFLDRRIYNATDNMDLVDLGRIKDGEDHEIKDDGSFLFSDFYDYITDPKVTTISWPYNPDSYILISAGLDGFYGTEDDITNF